MKTATSALQREIRQTKPFRSPAHEAALGILRTADAVRAVAARVVEPRGITLQQYNVLRILRGSEPGGLPTLAIADRMIERAPGITRLLDRLEARGLAARVRGEEDRRQVLCRITPAGLRLLAALDGPVDAADGNAVGGLSPSDLKRLIRLLDRVRAGIRDAAPPPSQEASS